MKLLVERTDYTSKSTIGNMYRDGELQCHTLEDVVRTGPKVMHETAIPEGTYKVVKHMSPHFGRELPMLVDVPDFEGILIHPGNSAADTSGCILVGVDKQTDYITSSRLAFDALYPHIVEAWDKGEEVEITVRNLQ